MRTRLYTGLALLASASLTLGACNKDKKPNDAPTETDTMEEEATMEEEVEEEVEETEGEMDESATNDPDPVLEIVTYYTTPVDYVGVTVSGTAYVDEVISDRGFYLTDGDNDQRLFAVVREDTPKKEMIDINEGQTLQLTGLFLEKEMRDDLAGTLEEDTKQALAQTPYFLAVHHKDIKIMSGDQGGMKKDSGGMKAEGAEGSTY